MIRLKNKEDCCGCFACEQICPYEAIEIQEDSEGFLYPNVNIEKCIDCHLCEECCPVQHPAEETDTRRNAYVCHNKDELIRKDSTSGGAFSAIAQYVIDRGGVVFGASFDKNFQIVHTAAFTNEELSKFRGSKYVQSRQDDAFCMVKKYLQEGRWVCYSGTPCQIEGLHRFLRKDYEKLILIDLVCYSVLSPEVWNQYLKLLETKKRIHIQDIENIKFRDKTQYGYEYTMMSFYDKNGTICYASGPESNQLLRSFVSNTATRPSCYSCPFKKRNRISDFTIWDCYNIHQYDHHLDDNRGNSHIILHSLKGKQVLDEISDSLELISVDLDFAVNSEPALTQCAKPGEQRSAFFEMLSRTDNGEALDEFFPDSMRVKIERFLRRFLCETGLYRKAKRLANQILKK